MAIVIAICSLTNSKLGDVYASGSWSLRSVVGLGAELTLAVVDQALLELSPNPSWNILDAMYQRRPWGVQTATAQMEQTGAVLDRGDIRVTVLDQSRVVDIQGCQTPG